MRIPTDKQLQKRADTLRRKVTELKNAVDEIKSYDVSILGRKNRTFLQVSMDALKITEGALFEVIFNEK